jgi:penicillin amidase
LVGDMRYVYVALYVLLVAGIELGLGRRWGNIPPLGKFFSPFIGFWQQAEPRTHRPPERLNIPTLEDTVVVVWDTRWVPHIYAKNDRDLYRAQGYIQAYLRLWQMELQTDVAAGRLSRFLGERTLEIDRAIRRLGLPYAAERSYQLMMQDSITRTIIEAFAEGVNAYMATLSYKDLPLEYKLLDYWPERWTPFKSALLVKYMAYDLSVRSPDKYLTRLLDQWGKGAIDTLFPNLALFGATTILSSPAYEGPPIELPPQPKVYFSEAYQTDTVGLSIESDAEWVGSNNWAVSGKRTASGYPLLANDPHLTLTLPSIWLEMHLESPSVSVYGVTLMGAPGVIIGYNRAVAWGVTNVGPDAWDYYHLRYADDKGQSFWYNGQIVPLHPRPETLWVRTAWGTLKSQIDTVWYSPWGPVVHRRFDAIPRPLSGKAREAPLDAALRWIVYEPSNEALTFYYLNRARSLEDYKKALSHFGSPAQNFVYADTAGHIAMWARGYYPLRWREQGKFVLQAELPEHHWRDWLPMEANPHSIDPPEGFVRSANTHPAGPDYPYYLGWYFALPGRAARIAERLSTLRQATVDSMRLLQLDTWGYIPARALPIMLSYLRGKSARYLDSLRAWDYCYRGYQIAPTLFERWWKAFHNRLWDEAAARRPEWDVTLALLIEAARADSLQKPSAYARWIDDKQTPKVETLRELLEETFAQVEAEVVGKPDSLLWWWRERGNFLRHLGRIPGLGGDTLRADGNGQVVNAIGSSAGPSWRMVVDLKPPVQGYGIYPGGQSGNPGSFQFAAFVKDYEAGRLYRHYFYPSAADFGAGERLGVSVGVPGGR